MSLTAQDENWYFLSAHQALCWSTEVLRHKRHPNISSLYQEIPSQLDTNLDPDWSLDWPHLPSDGQERVELAQTVQAFLRYCSADEQDLLQKIYWGDYHHPQHLARSLYVQETLRQKGVRAHVKMRYNHKQLAEMLQVHPRTISRRLKIAQDKIAEKLQLKGLLPSVASTTIVESAHNVVV